MSGFASGSGGLTGSGAAAFGCSGFAGTTDGTVTGGAPGFATTGVTAPPGGFGFFLRSVDVATISCFTFCACAGSMPSQPLSTFGLPSFSFTRRGAAMAAAAIGGAATCSVSPWRMFTIFVFLLIAVFCGAKFTFTFSTGCWLRERTRS